MTEPSLFDWTPPLLHPRLETLQERVHAFMRDGKWHTLAEIKEACGGSETSVSARVRDMRKEDRGGHKVQAEYVKRGLWRYRLVPVTEGEG